MVWIQEKSKRDSVMDWRNGTEVLKYRNDLKEIELGVSEEGAEIIIEIFFRHVYILLTWVGKIMY